MIGKRGNIGILFGLRQIKYYRYPHILRVHAQCAIKVRTAKTYADWMSFNNRMPIHSVACACAMCNISCSSIKKLERR